MTLLDDKVFSLSSEDLLVSQHFRFTTVLVIVIDGLMALDELEASNGTTAFTMPLLQLIN